MAAAIAGSTYIEMKGIGHLQNLEAPEDFDGALLNFLAQPRVLPATTERANACWSIDFTSDTLADDLRAEVVRQLAYRPVDLAPRRADGICGRSQRSPDGRPAQGPLEADPLPA